MSQPLGPNDRNVVALLGLLACLAGFGVAILGENMWRGAVFANWRETWALSWLLPAVVCWMVVAFPEHRWHEGIRFWVDGFLAIMGTNLLVQSGLAYVWNIPPASWSLIITSSALSIVLTGLIHLWPTGKAAGRDRILLVSSDNLTNSLRTELPAKVMWLAEGNPLPADLEDRTALPGVIILGTKPNAISYWELLRLHYAGVEVEGAPMVYERVRQRVPWEYLRPSDLLFFLNPNTSPTMQAFQAVYKNLLGLTVRVVFAPLLILTSLLIILFTDGPALEHIECLGFRGIPFQMLRFQIHHSDRTFSRIGRLIDRLHLTNLPQLMNVVRGEMTLFGPAPVRTAFAHRLSELLPPYAYRFTVKPGIFGWPDPVVDRTGGLPDEAALLELDLYYVKQESLSLDLLILLRMFRSRSAPRKETATSAGVTSHF